MMINDDNNNNNNISLKLNIHKSSIDYKYIFHTKHNLTYMYIYMCHINKYVCN